MVLATDSLWQSVVSAALVGTERQPFNPPTAPGHLGQVLGQMGQSSPESALLITAAAIALYHQTGWIPAFDPAPSPTPCPAEEQSCCNLQATRFLQAMLQGQYPQVLPEWLAIAHQKRQRIPEICLPAVLDWGKQHREFRDKILSVVGQRGRWLATQNPEWNYAVAVNPESDWETGSTAARILYLQALRSTDPAQARELLQTTWQQESASDRTKFLELFHTQLSLEDEDFLEEKLRDRSKEVRRVAGDLLASLPDSRLCQQMSAAVQPYITLTRKPTPKVNVQLPDTFDPAWTQWGIEENPVKLFPSNIGEKTGWLLQILGATPLQVWCDAWSMTPAEIVHHTKKKEWGTLLLNGWALAAKRQKNRAWIRELLSIYLQPMQPKASFSILPELGSQELISVLSLEEQSDFLMGYLQGPRETLNDIFVIWVLRQSHTSWNLELAYLILKYLAQLMVQQSTRTNIFWTVSASLKELAGLLPIAVLPEAHQLQTNLPGADSPWHSSINEFLAVLQFRQEMTEAFEEPMT